MTEDIYVFFVSPIKTICESVCETYGPFLDVSKNGSNSGPACHVFQIFSQIFGFWTNI